MAAVRRPHRRRRRAAPGRRGPLGQRPGGGALLARRVSDARGRGYPVRLVDTDELARLLPEARVGPVTAACFAPNDGQVEPPLVLAACRAVLAEHVEDPVASSVAA